MIPRLAIYAMQDYNEFYQVNSKGELLDVYSTERQQRGSAGS